MTNENTAIAPYDYSKYGNAGFEGTTPDDFTIPFLKLLQTNSPEIEDPQKRIPGAEAGMFMNTANRAVWNPVLIVPAAREQRIFEWVPRTKGGGFVGQRAIDDPMVIQAQADAAKTETPWKWTTPTGNELVDTRFLYALVIDALDATDHLGFVVIPFAKTKIRHYKDIMTAMRSIKGRPPIFANRLRLESFLDRSKRNGKMFFNTKISFAIDNNDLKSLLPSDSPLLRAGNGLHTLVTGGKVKVDLAQHENETPGAEAEAEF